MISLSGELGNGALGAFVLGRPRTAVVFVPHRGRAQAVISADSTRSAVRSSGARSAITARTPRGEVGSG